MIVTPRLGFLSKSYRLKIFYACLKLSGILKLFGGCRLSEHFVLLVGTEQLLKSNHLSESVPVQNCMVSRRTGGYHVGTFNIGLWIRQKKLCFS